MSEVLRDVGGGGGRETVVGSDGGADSLLPIVSSQRERFRQRNVELEAVREGEGGREREEGGELEREGGRERVRRRG